MIITNFHVVKQIAENIKDTKTISISEIKQIFAAGRNGNDILIATGSPNAIRKVSKIVFSQIVLGQRVSVKVPKIHG